jgi:hypothetical protein
MSVKRTGSEHAVGLLRRPRARHERSDFSQERFLISCPWKGVDAGKLDELGPRDPIGDVPAALDRDVLISCSVQHERRDMDGREHAAQVDCGHPS